MGAAPAHRTRCDRTGAGQQRLFARWPGEPILPANEGAAECIRLGDSVRSRPDPLVAVCGRLRRAVLPPEPAATGATLRRRIWLDVLIGVALATAAAWASFTASRQIDPALCRNEKAWDVWFEADLPRVYDNLTERLSDHYRASVHPLFTLLLFPVTRLVQRSVTPDALTAVRTVLAGTAALWTATVYAVLRLVGCHVLDAMLFCALAATSASALFWFVVPEVYCFGSLTILLPLLLVARAQHRRPREGGFAIASLLSLSMTSTNWMAGIVATAACFPWRRVLLLTGLAFGLYAALFPVQAALFPNTRFVFSVGEEPNFIAWREYNRVPDVLRSFFFHALVMPEIRVDGTVEPVWPVRLHTQHSPAGSAGPWGAVGVGLWAALLAVGLLGLLCVRAQGRFRLALGLILAGQLALHLVYGEETFLYACHFGVLLVLLAAWGTFTHARPVVLALAAGLIICNVVNNTAQLARATGLAHPHEPAGALVQAAVYAGPHDPGPSREGIP